MIKNILIASPTNLSNVVSELIGVDEYFILESYTWNSYEVWHFRKLYKISILLFAVVFSTCWPLVSKNKILKIFATKFSKKFFSVNI